MILVLLSELVSFSRLNGINRGTPRTWVFASWNLGLQGLKKLAWAEKASRAKLKILLFGSRSLFSWLFETLEYYCMPTLSTVGAGNHWQRREPLVETTVEVEDSLVQHPQEWEESESPAAWQHIRGSSDCIVVWTGDSFHRFDCWSSW